MKSIGKRSFFAAVTCVLLLSTGVAAQEEDSELMRETTMVQDVYVKDEQTFWVVANGDNGKGKIFL